MFPFVILAALGGALWWLGKSQAPAAKTMAASGGGNAAVKTLARANAAGEPLRRQDRGAAPSVSVVPLEGMVLMGVARAAQEAQEDMREAEAVGQLAVMAIVGSSETTQAAYEAGSAGIGLALEAGAAAGASAAQAATTVDQQVAAGIRGWGR